MSTFIEKLGNRLWRGRMPAADTKAAAGPYVAINGLGRPAWSARNYAGFAREGMIRNAVVYRCIRMMAEAAASVRLEACAGREAVPDHPMLDLIDRPAHGRTRFDFFEHWYSTLLISGNVFVHAAAAGGQIRQLHLLRPDRTSVLRDGDGWPAGVEYQADGRRMVYDGEAVDGVDAVLHVKLFHPFEDYYGLSPVEPAASAIDIHNAAALWSKALLDNAARPSGALVYSAGGNLSGDQYDRLVGIFSSTDIREVIFSRGIGHLIVMNDVATFDIIVTFPSDDLNSVLQKFTTKNIDSLPVVKDDDHGILIGMLNRREVISFYNEKIQEMKSRANTNRL